MRKNPLYLAECERCGVATDRLSPFPFRYKMAGHERADESDYVQFYGCTTCLAKEHYRGKRPLRFILATPRLVPWRAR